MEYTEKHIGWEGSIKVLDAEYQGYQIRIWGNDVTITGETLKGRIVRDGLETIEAAQEWVNEFFKIAATTPIEQSRFFVPNDPDSYYSTEGKGQQIAAKNPATEIETEIEEENGQTYQHREFEDAWGSDEITGALTIDTSSGKVQIEKLENGGYKVHSPYESQETDTITKARKIACEMATILEVGWENS
jgi:hypothetical protein